MKVRSIPAQITTVEDKIVGNINLSQMLLLMVPVFWGMIVYTLFTPAMNFAWYKLLLFLTVAVISLCMALRIKDKIVLSWIIILLKYNLRPKYYMFNKNESYVRQMDMIAFEKNKTKSKKAHSKQTQIVKNTKTSFGDLIRLENIISNPKYSFSIKSQKKGAFYVAIEQKQE